MNISFKFLDTGMWLALYFTARQRIGSNPAGLKVHGDPGIRQNIS